MQTTDAVQRQAIAQLDYTKSFDKRRKLEMGYKGDARWLDRDYLVQKDALGHGHVGAEQPEQRVRVRRAGAGRLRRVQPGRRQVRHAGRPARGVREPRLPTARRRQDATRTTTRACSRARTSCYNMSDATQLKASYSRRIRRPGTQELNPFPSFFDIQNVFLGNPNLSPEYTDAVELGLDAHRQARYAAALAVLPAHDERHSRRHQHRGRGRRARRDVDQLQEPRDEQLVGRRRATARCASARRSARSAASTSSSMVTDGGSTSAVGSNAVTWMARTNITATLTSRTTLQGNYMYRAPMKIERGEFSAMQNANFVAPPEDRRRQGGGARSAWSIRSTRTGSPSAPATTTLMQINAALSRRARGVPRLPVQLRTPAARAAAEARGRAAGVDRLPRLT